MKTITVCMKNHYMIRNLAYGVQCHSNALSGPNFARKLLIHNLIVKHLRKFSSSWMTLNDDKFISNKNA